MRDYTKLFERKATLEEFAAFWDMSVDDFLTKCTDALGTCPICEQANIIKFKDEYTCVNGLCIKNKIVMINKT